MSGSPPEDPFPVMTDSLPILGEEGTVEDEIAAPCPGSEPAASPRSTVVSCASCPIRDCPTRGLAGEELNAVLEAERASAMSSTQMVFSSVAVFLLPLICAVAGVYLWNGLQIGNLSSEAGAVCGALSGFLTGVLLVQLAVRVLRRHLPE